ERCLLEVEAPALRAPAVRDVGADRMLYPASRMAVEAMAREGGMEMVRRGVAELDLLPEHRPAVPDDPGRVVAHLLIGSGHVVRDREDLLLREPPSYHGVGARQLGLIFLGRARQFEFGKLAVAVALG